MYVLNFTTNVEDKQRQNENYSETNNAWQPQHGAIPHQCVKCATVCRAVVQLVEYRTCNQEVVGSTHTRSTASILEQVANLLCAQVNSASYPQRDGKWVVATATGWKPSVADWGDGVSASYTVGPIVR